MGLRTGTHSIMKISQLIIELERTKAEYGDLPITGVHIPGHPEMEITGTWRVLAGPVITAHPNNAQDDLPERFLLEWEVIY